MYCRGRSLFITTAFILWALKISSNPARPIDTMDFADLFLSAPRPFAAHFEPRQPLARIRAIIDADTSD